MSKQTYTTRRTEYVVYADVQGDGSEHVTCTDTSLDVVRRNIAAWDTRFVRLVKREIVSVQTVTTTEQAVEDVEDELSPWLARTIGETWEVSTIKPGAGLNREYEQAVFTLRDGQRDVNVDPAISHYGTAGEALAAHAAMVAWLRESRG